MHTGIQFHQTVTIRQPPPPRGAAWLLLIMYGGMQTLRAEMVTEIGGVEKPSSSRMSCVIHSLADVEPLQTRHAKASASGSVRARSPEDRVHGVRFHHRNQLAGRRRSSRRRCRLCHEARRLMTTVAAHLNSLLKNDGELLIIVLRSA